MENLQDSKTLRALGLNEKNHWVLYDEKPKAFFEYIAANIDSFTYLSEAEQYQFSELYAAGHFLESDALTEELKNLECHFPGILTINDEEIDEKKRDLDFLNQDVRERKERVVRMCESERRQLRDIEALEKKHFELDYQEKQLVNDSLQKAGELMKLQKSNQSRIMDLKQTYLLPVSCVKCRLFNSLIRLLSFRKILLHSFTRCHSTNISKNVNIFLQSSSCSCARDLTLQTLPRKLKMIGCRTPLSSKLESGFRKLNRRNMRRALLRLA